MFELIKSMNMKLCRRILTIYQIWKKSNIYIYSMRRGRYKSGFGHCERFLRQRQIANVYLCVCVHTKCLTHAIIDMRPKISKILTEHAIGPKSIFAFCNHSSPPLFHLLLLCKSNHCKPFGFTLISMILPNFVCATGLIILWWQKMFKTSTIHFAYHSKYLYSSARSLEPFNLTSGKVSLSIFSRAFSVFVFFWYFVLDILNIHILVELF